MAQKRARPDPEEWISTRVCAELAGVAQNTINYWLRTGRIKKRDRRVTTKGQLVRAGALYALIGDRRPRVVTIRRRMYPRPRRS